MKHFLLMLQFGLETIIEKDAWWPGRSLMQYFQLPRKLCSHINYLVIVQHINNNNVTLINAIINMIRRHPLDQTTFKSAAMLELINDHDKII